MIPAGGEVVVLLGVLLGLALGIVPGIWIGATGRERRKGHAWLAGIVAVIAAAGVSLYTFGDSSEQLFTRVVALPLTILIAFAAAATVAGIPMYASYLFSYRIASRFAAKRHPGPP
jgi:hypothetical protein